MDESTAPSTIINSSSIVNHHHSTTPIIATNPKLHELLAMQQHFQRHWYGDWIEQQKKIFAAATNNNNGAGASSSSVGTADGGGVQRDLKSLAQSLKQEIIANLSSAIDKVQSIISSLY